MTGLIFPAIELEEDTLKNIYFSLFSHEIQPTKSSEIRPKTNQKKCLKLFCPNFCT